MKVVSLIIECGGIRADIPIEAVHFSGYSDECETCGTHGEVNIGCTCPICQKYYTQEVHSW